MDRARGLNRAGVVTLCGAPGLIMREGSSSNPQGLLGSTLAWSQARRWVAVAVAFVCAFPLAIVAGEGIGHIFVQADTPYYLAMAAGKIYAVVQPFASRQLEPLLVRGMVHLLHLSIQTSFLTLGILSLAFSLVAVFFLLVRSGAPRWMLIAVAGLLFWGA